MFRSHSTVRISTRHVASVWSSDLLAFPFYHPHGKGVRQQMWLCHNCHSCGLGWRELQAGEQVTPTAQLTGATHEAGKPRSAPSTPGAKRRPGRAVTALVPGPSAPNPRSAPWLTLPGKRRQRSEKWTSLHQVAKSRALLIKYLVSLVAEANGS